MLAIALVSQRVPVVNRFDDWWLRFRVAARWVRWHMGFGLNHGPKRPMRAKRIALLSEAWIKAVRARGVQRETLASKAASMIPGLGRLARKPFYGGRTGSAAPGSTRGVCACARKKCATLGAGPNSCTYYHLCSCSNRV